jgi:hypothetical protein
MSAAKPLECPYDCEPAAAVEAIASHEGPVFVDLDETLYLRNSTEDFIDLARPGVIALLLLRLLEIIKPWRFTGGASTRDVWRVRLIWMLFPWTRGRWAREVYLLARNYSNRELLETLRSLPTPPVVLTVGFAPIVTPLVRAMGLTEARIVAARLNSFADRRDGKLQCAITHLGEHTLRDALVITDSIQDLALLHVCARPLRTVWPEARYRRALSSVYLPGQYLTQVKRPGEPYIRRAILQEDFAFWVLASVAAATHPLLHVIGLLFLLASFWTIYERGYVDNDLCAAQYEHDPKLSKTFWEMPVAISAWQPWAWALPLGAVGVALVRWPHWPSPMEALTWVGVLIATHSLFLLYNRVDKATRVWMFAGLQFARAAAFMPLVAVPPIGAMAVGAHALARWVPYYLYRTVGQNWPGEAGLMLIRVVFFIALGVLLGLSSGPAAVLNWTAALLLGWNLYRARYLIHKALIGIRRIDRDPREERAKPPKSPESSRAA